MFVNSCLFKVCFVWILAFLSLRHVFIFFSFRLKLNIAAITQAVFYAASSIVKKSLLPHVFMKRERKKKTTQKPRVQTFFFFQFFFLIITLPFNRNYRNCSGLKLCRQVALKQIAHWNYDDKAPLPCWRRHLTLHMKTVLFRSLWIIYTLHPIKRCDKSIFGPKRWILSQF